MPVPSRTTIDLYLLHEIQEMGGAILVPRQNEELEGRLRKYFPDMTDSEASERPKNRKYGGNPRFKRSVNQARRSLVNKRLLDGSQEGRWGPITAEGRRWLNENWSPRESI